MLQELKAFQRKLTNLTSNNKSLVQLRLSKSQDFDLNELDFLNNTPAFDIIPFLLSSKRKYELCDVLDSRNTNVNECSKTLKKIHRSTQFLLDERGVKELYIGWPFVVGKMADGTSVRCPLLFFPVDLEIHNAQWRISKRADEQIIFNKSFLLAYSFFNGVSLSDDFVDQTFEENGDAQEFRNALYALLKASKLEINFNTELFENKLKHFHSYKREEFDTEFSNGIIRLENQAVLGIYPQAGSYLVPDYDAWMANIQTPSLEEFFMLKSQIPENNSIDRYRFLKQVKEEQTFTPFPMDASQENALKAIKKGNSVVVQGPPGTGKSQLISNLIADFIARGKNVLVVCQKRVALDVVYGRLKEKDLSDFIAVVHDFKNDRKKIYHQLHQQVEKIPTYQQLNNGLDTIYLEREYLQTCRKIDQIAEELDTYRNVLFDTTECGISIKELYLLANREAERIAINQYFKFFDRTHIHQLVDFMDWYIPYAIQFENPNFVLFERKNLSAFNPTDLDYLLEILKNITFYQNDFSSKIASLLGDAISIAESTWILDRREKLEDFVDLLQQPNVYAYFQFILQQKGSDADWLVLKEKQIMSCFKGDGVETSLTHEEIGEYHTMLASYTHARKRIDRWVKWWLFSKDKYKLKRVLVANGLDWNRDGFETLSIKIDNRLNLQHFVNELQAAAWVTGLKKQPTEEELKQWFHDYSRALQAKKMADEARNFIKYIPFQKFTAEELKERVKQVLSWCEVAANQLLQWSQYLTPKQITSILEDGSKASILAASFKEHFDNLCFYDKAKHSLEPNERVVIEKLLEKAKTKEDATQLFKESVYHAWIEYIESKHPVLKEASTLKFDQLEKELQQCIVKKLALSKDILLLKTREQTYRNVEYNRLNNMVTYRELEHQVTKKRQIWPLRKLFAEHGEEVLKLTPCWMASPESVSAIFPMQMSFDLVIFDEASQCFTEKGLPAIYRAKQVVVTGDKHQLGPNDLYQIRYEEEEEVSSNLEVDSLLDLSSKYLMQVQLNGHYRSERLELIDFSNQYFYNNELQLLPAFKHINTRHAAIKYVKVAGIWEGGVNPVEARKVVDIVFEKMQEGITNLGVVTFNYKQQNYILDLLDERAAETNTLLPVDLFVKNIENVQGDERDVIIFSVGYAENAMGKMNMHFGSINMEKGENRLNVAVTRARTNVLVVASILPHQLQVEDAKHLGPKLFKKYLEYALEVSNGKYVPSLPKNPQLSKEWFLNAKLMQQASKKVSCDTSLPFADISVSENGEYKGLVLTDDNSYFSSLSAKSYHGYLQLALQSKKWPYVFLKSRNYWLNREKEIAKVESFTK